MYTRLFCVKIPYELQPDTDIFESYAENEKDSAHLPKHYPALDLTVTLSV